MALAALVWAAKANAAPLNRNHYLLLDNRVIEQTDNTKLAVGTVSKSSRNPLFGEDQPWEARFDNLYANVLYDADEHIYKCWYSPFIVDRSAHGMTFEQRLKTAYRPPRDREMGLCYATSTDGLTWRKPALGLVNFRGSKANNLVYRKTPEMGHEPHGAGVFQDLRDPDSSRRYKMFFKGRTISVAFSADGIHWGKPLACPEANVRGDTHNNAFWAPTRHEYVGITRKFARPRGRQVARTASRDFVHWSTAKVVLEGLENHLQTYAMPVFPYAGVYLGLVAIFNTQTDRVHTELTWSPDTLVWHRIDPGHPLIPNSSKGGDYDWGCVYPAANPIFETNQIRLYYGGSDGRHFGYRNGFFCLATLRPDGFAGYEPIAATEPARLMTALITVKGTLVLNADVEPDGYVAIRLLSRSGKELARARPVKETAVNAKLEWLSAWKAEARETPVRLEFEFRKAKVYSFSWQP